jgi:hypothetical protein
VTLRLESVVERPLRLLAAPERLDSRIMVREHLVQHRANTWCNTARTPSRSAEPAGQRRESQAVARSSAAQKTDIIVRMPESGPEVTA